MQAKHVFIFHDAFNPDGEVVGGGKGLRLKYSPKSYSVTSLWIDTNKSKIADAFHEEIDVSKKSSTFSNRVGVHLITHMNNPFELAGPVKVATLICDYLDSRKDLGIDCTHLDKLVFVTCVGAGGLKREFHDESALKEINKHAQKQDRFYRDYTKAAKEWDEKRQKYLDEQFAQFEKDGATFLKESPPHGSHMVRFACALDQRGAHPKIAAWDDSLFVRDDGHKSIHSEHGSVVQRHQRLLHKMMIQFTRSTTGLGAIQQLDLQQWSDKPLNLPK